MASLRREPEEREANLLSSPPSLPLSSSPSLRLFFSGQQQPEQCSDQRLLQTAWRSTGSSSQHEEKQRNQQPGEQQPATPASSSLANSSDQRATSSQLEPGSATHSLFRPAAAPASQLWRPCSLISSLFFFFFSDKQQPRELRTAATSNNN
ncbi:hypothetical protein MTR67_043788 [Solanum verrucosum]|uniref:Uncharacterized protein n=1 Tax=Solanum verrucosum TaxID=315347 RepID=A0AAF0ZUN7_SOLVR|nr:hypothetical protein MTR67_043788 [Solanum verrucosum]